MFESKNMKMVRIIAIVDRVWEARHQVTAPVFLDDSPAFWRFENHRNRGPLPQETEHPALQRGSRNSVWLLLIQFPRRGGRSVAFERAPGGLHNVFMCATSHFA